MDPITLLTAGPALLRMVGGLFGGKTAETANTVANVVDAARGLPTAAASAKVAQHLAQLPPEDLVALKQVEIKLAEVARDREANRLAAATAQHRETQETARTEAGSADEYVRRTRPKLARQSAYMAFAYAILTGVGFEVLNAVYGVALPAVDTWIIAALYAPCLTYMGVRSVDAFSRKGKT